MRAKTILSVLFMTSVVVVALLYLASFPRQDNRGLEVLVATAVLPAGTLLRVEDVAWRPLKGDLGPGAIPRPSSANHDVKKEADNQEIARILGSVTRTTIKSGGTIQLSDIVEPGDRDFLATVLSPDMRAITVLQPDISGGALFIFPGDRVDILLTRNFQLETAASKTSVNQIFAENIRVLAVDKISAKTPIAAEGAGVALTLEVSPREAQRIDIARHLGKLSFVLRSALAPTMSHSAMKKRPEDMESGPIWAADVTVEPTSVAVLRGSKSEIMKSVNSASQ